MIRGVQTTGLSNVLRLLPLAKLLKKDLMQHLYGGCVVALLLLTTVEKILRASRVSRHESRSCHCCPFDSGVVPAKKTQKGRFASEFAKKNKLIFC